MARCRSGDKPLSYLMKDRLLTPICVPRPQWVMGCPKQDKRSQDLYTWSKIQLWLCNSRFYPYPSGHYISNMSIFRFSQCHCRNCSIYWFYHRDSIGTDDMTKTTQRTTKLLGYTAKPLIKDAPWKAINYWPLRWSWSIACRRCSNYIFIFDSTPGFNTLHKDNYKTRREAFKCWVLVRVILEILRYFGIYCMWPHLHHLWTPVKWLLML